MSEELKPCPFCGKEVLLRDARFIGDDGVEWPTWEIQCVNSKCLIFGSEIEAYAGKHEAITAWNTRPTEARFVDTEQENYEIRRLTHELSVAEKEAERIQKEFDEWVDEKGMEAAKWRSIAEGLAGRLEDLTEQMKRTHNGNYCAPGNDCYYDCLEVSVDSLTSEQEKTDKALTAYRKAKEGE